jgi:hypothetical protein
LLHRQCPHVILTQSSVQYVTEPHQG